MSIKKAIAKLGVATFLGVTGFAGTASAIDIMPGDYTVLPAGTNVVLVYGQYTTSSKLHVEGVGDIPDSSLDTTVGIARYIHYTNIGGVPVALQAFLPFGNISDASVFGAEPDTDDGVGDLTVGVTAFPVSSAKPDGTTVGITMYLTAPTSSFDSTPGAINVGSGTWTIMPQVGLIQGLGNGWFLDAAVDLSYQFDHEEDGLEFSRDASLQAQTYIRYQFSAATAVSFGYSGTYGGESSIEGNYTGIKTADHQLRAFASTFVTPTLQVQGMVGRSMETEGGFKQDFVGTLRLLKLF